MRHCFVFKSSFFAQFQLMPLGGSTSLRKFWCRCWPFACPSAQIKRVSLPGLRSHAGRTRSTVPTKTPPFTWLTCPTTASRHASGAIRPWRRTRARALTVSSINRAAQSQEIGCWVPVRENVSQPWRPSQQTVSRAGASAKWDVRAHVRVYAPRDDAYPSPIMRSRASACAYAWSWKVGGSTGLSW